MINAQYEFHAWRPVAEESHEDIARLQAFASLVLREAGVGFTPTPLDNLHIDYLSSSAVQQAIENSEQFATLVREDELACELRRQAPPAFRSPIYADVGPVKATREADAANLAFLVYGKTIIRDRKYIAETYRNLSGLTTESPSPHPLVFFGRAHGDPGPTKALARALLPETPRDILFDKPQYGRSVHPRTHYV